MSTNLIAAQVGETWKFRHHFRGVRLFQITDIDTIRMDGQDLYDKQSCHYELIFCTEPKLVAKVGEKVVLPADVFANKSVDHPRRLLAAYKALHPEARDVRWSHDAMAFVERTSYEPRVEVRIKGYDVEICFYNERNQVLKLNFILRDNTHLNKILKATLKVRDAKRFAHLLFDHFNYDGTTSQEGEYIG